MRGKGWLMRNAIFTALMSPVHISTQLRQKQIRDVDCIPKTLKTYQHNHHLRLCPHTCTCGVCVSAIHIQKKYSQCISQRLSTLSTRWHYAYHCEQLFLMANSRQNINIMTPQFLHGQMTQRHSTMIHFPTDNRIEYRSKTST